MATNTTRMAIPHPDSADNPGLVTDLAALANQVDAMAAIYGQGTLAGRPAAGVIGRVYYATDSLQHYWDTGAAWVPLGSVTPAGVIEDWAGSSTPPNGYLLCDGAAVSRTTYAALFAALGVTYGSGDGSTTFNVPDCRGRTRVAVGTHADVNARNLNDGLSVGSRRPKHKHTVTDPTHFHTLPGEFEQPNYGGPTQPGQGFGSGSTNNPAVVTNAAATGITVGPQTGAEPVDTMAFVTCYAIIKT